MRVKIDGQPYELRTAIGEGGEARLYKVAVDGKYLAAKIYKGPNDPDYAGNDPQDIRNRDGAARRLDICGRKLAEFPKGLPAAVIAPGRLVTNTAGATIGFCMDMVPDPRTPLRRLSEKDYRQGMVSDNDVVTSFKRLRALVEGIHLKQVVIGDFNDLNVLVGSKPELVNIIDADSFQFGKWHCATFTQRFGDPRLCNPKETKLVLHKPHDCDSDWYAFAIMLFQSLCYITPYDGIYKPKDKSKKIPHDSRPLHGISVFNTEVTVPKFATSFKVLPDDLLHQFHGMFSPQQTRGTFPTRLMDNMRWTDCIKCGTSHARNTCPVCQAPGKATTVMEARGTVTCERIFKTSGHIVCSTYSWNKLHFAHVEDSVLYLNNVKIPGFYRPRPGIRYRIGENKLYAAHKDRLFYMPEPAAGPPVMGIDTYQGICPVYDVADKRLFYVNGDRLECLNEGTFDDNPRFIGNVLPGNTMFWAGPSFGFGFYRAADISEFFVFDTHAGRLKDSLPVPRLRGQVYDTTCAFSARRCWFFATYQYGGQTINRCSLLDQHGNVLGYAEANAGDDSSWLGHIRGHVAAGETLFAPTDDGITRVELRGTDLVAIKTFPDTEPFVDSHCQLQPAKEGGLHVITGQEIRLLRIS